MALKSGKSLIKWAAIVVYLISLPLAGESAPRSNMQVWFMLVFGGLSIPDVLFDRGNPVIAGIWLSNFAAIGALWTSRFRNNTSVALAALAVAAGLPAFTSFDLPVPLGSLVHAPALGTYVWMTAYGLLLAYCLSNHVAFDIRTSPDKAEHSHPQDAP